MAARHSLNKGRRYQNAAKLDSVEKKKSIGIKDYLYDLRWDGGSLVESQPVDENISIYTPQPQQLRVKESFFSFVLRPLQSASDDRGCVTHAGEDKLPAPTDC